MNDDSTQFILDRTSCKDFGDLICDFMKNELSYMPTLDMAPYDLESNLDVSEPDLHNADEPRFICSICSRQFKSKIYLNKHLKIVHNDCRKFKCTYCNADFKRKYDLKVHNSIHMARAKIPCNLCNVKFSTVKNLNKHRRKFHSS